MHEQCYLTRLRANNWVQISAASSQIEATIGERYPLRNADGSYKLNAKGQHIADYGLTQAIFMACVCGGLLIMGKNKEYYNCGRCTRVNLCL